MDKLEYADKIIEIIDAETPISGDKYKLLICVVDSIIATARAEALREAREAIADYNQMSEHSVNDDYLIGYGYGVRDCQIRIEKILADKQEEK